MFDKEVFKVSVKDVENKDTVLVYDQVPKYGISLKEGSIICLYTSNEDVRVETEVPNVKDMSQEAAMNSLKSKNLNIKVDGTTGIVVSQDPTFGTKVEEGTVVNVVIKEKLTDAQ